MILILKFSGSGLLAFQPDMCKELKSKLCPTSSELKADTEFMLLLNKNNFSTYDLCDSCNFFGS